jgi:hypothetical protein
VIQEELYDRVRDSILTRNFHISPLSKDLGSNDRKVLNPIIVNALWDLQFETDIDKDSYREALVEASNLHLAFPEKIRLFLLFKISRMTLRGSEELLESLLTITNRGRISQRSLAVLLNHQDSLEEEGWAPLFARFGALYPNYYRLHRSLSSRTTKVPNYVIRDLYHRSNHALYYKGGLYFGKPTLFMFCRSDRTFPCLFLMKDRWGTPVRTPNGSLWHQPALGLSKYGIPSHKRNGNTPSGIHEINGVMPFANKPYSFGKWRRLILNFVPASEIS